MRIAITENEPEANAQFAIATTFMDAAMMFHPWCPREEYAMLCGSVRRGRAALERLNIQGDLDPDELQGAEAHLKGLPLPEAGGFTDDEIFADQTLHDRLSRLRETADDFLSHLRDLVDRPDATPSP